MEFIRNILDSFRSGGEDILQTVILFAVVIFGFLLAATLARFLFGKEAQLNIAVCSAVEILCLYVLAIVIFAFGLQWKYLSPLPFVTLTQNQMHIYPILTADFTQTCGQIVRLLIIAFLVNVANSLIPKGEHVITWYLFRLLAVILAFAANYATDLLLTAVLPSQVLLYAPVVLLVVLIVLVLLGSLKLLVGAALTFLDPIIGGLYTFFFSNVVGRQLARAIVTTALLVGLVYAMNAMGITTIPATLDALKGSVPMLAIVLVLWYIVGHIL